MRLLLCPLHGGTANRMCDTLCFGRWRIKNVASYFNATFYHNDHFQNTTSGELSGIAESLISGKIGAHWLLRRDYVHSGLPLLFSLV